MPSKFVVVVVWWGGWPSNNFVDLVCDNFLKMYIYTFDMVRLPKNAKWGVRCQATLTCFFIFYLVWLIFRESVEIKEIQQNAFQNISE